MYSFLVKYKNSIGKPYDSNVVKCEMHRKTPDPIRENTIVVRAFVKEKRKNKSFIRKDNEYTCIYKARESTYCRKKKYIYICKKSKL